MESGDLDSGRFMAKRKNPKPSRGGRKKSRARRVHRVIGYALLAGGLLYIFHGIHFSRLFSELGHLRWSLVALAVAINLASYITWGLAWKWLLFPVARVSLYDASKAIYAGQFANQLLPARLGELFRAYLLARWLSAEFVEVIPSVIASRLLDGIWSVAGVAVVAAYVPLPRSLLLGGTILAILILGGAGSLIYFAYTRHQVMEAWAKKKGSGGKRLRFLKWFLGHLATGITDIGFTRYSLQAFLISPFWLFFQGLSFWLVMRAYGLHLPVWAGAATFLIIHFGTLLPNAPGNGGVYQFFCVVGLTLFGVDKTTAAGFSIVVYALLIGPILLVGFLAFSRSGLTAEEIRKGLENFREQRASTGARGK